MNPLTNVKNLQKLNEKELELGLAGSKTSWHKQYSDSAWVFVGGLPYDLTEGDVICAFSQYGEIVNINYARDKATGKPKGFCFICFEDQRSTILTVDNLNGIKLLGRTLRVDHVANYKPPKVDEDVDEITKALRERGCAPKASSDEEPNVTPLKKPKKEKKKKRKKDECKKKKHEKKRKRKHKTSSTSDTESAAEIKKEIGDVVENYVPERQTVRHCLKHNWTDKGDYLECNDNTREEPLRKLKLEKETNRKRHSDQTVPRREDDDVCNMKSKKKKSDEKSGRNISEHRERMRDSSSRRRMYDYRHNERSRRDTTGEGYTEKDQIRKYM